MKLSLSRIAEFAQARGKFDHEAVAEGYSIDTRTLQPGDLFFFRHDASFHSMIYLGASQLRPDGNLYVIYHTGPDSGGPGEIKRLTMSELLHFPQLDWRPLAANHNFLGVYRWNILREAL